MRRSGTRHARRSAIVAVALIGIATYAAFVKQTPFSDHFRIAGVFQSGNQLRKGNPVRVSGIDVGKVTGLEAGPRGTTVVEMELTKPDVIGAGAALAIRPRLLFEGNYYVRISPGPPGLGPIRKNAVIPLERTSIPVQVDQVLNVLDTPFRGAFQRTIGELATGLDPRGARRSVRALDAALADFTVSTRAARGQRAGDLTRLISGSADVATQLATNPAALADSVTNFHRVSAAFAARDQELGASVAAFDRLARRAPDDLEATGRALPSVTRFATALRPALQRAPAALRAGTAVLEQTRAVTQSQRLPALLDETRPLAADLPGVQRQLTQAMGYLTPIARCAERTIIPTLKTPIPDDALSTNDPVWLDFLHLGASLAGSSPDFDGNGSTIRLGTTSGAQAVRQNLAGVGEVISRADAQGLAPEWLGYGVDPPERPDAQCSAQDLPDLGARRGPPPTGGEKVTLSKDDDPAEDLMRRLLFTPAGDRRDELRRQFVELLGIQRRASRQRERRRPEVQLPTKERIPPLRDHKPSGRPVRKPVDEAVDTVKETVAPIKPVIDQVQGLLNSLPAGGLLK